MRLQTHKDGIVSYRPLPVTECSDMCDGAVRTWKEFVPSCYDGSEGIPLVISLHGGPVRPGTMHTGEKTNALTHVGEKYGFAVAYAQSLSDEICWNVWECYDDEFGMQYKDDVVYLDWLIDTMCAKYAIDESRIYLYAHSFGDIMGTEYALKRSNRLAAAALLSGPSNSSAFTDRDGTFRFGRTSALPVMRFHGSEDLGAPSGMWPHASEKILARCNPVRTLIDEDGGITDRARRLKMELTQMPNILLWSSINGAGELPEFSLFGDLGIASYHGDEDFHFVCLEEGGHFPPVWAAEWTWKYFFSHHALREGRHVSLDGEAQLQPDRNVVIVAAEATSALRGGELVQLAEPVSAADDELRASKVDAEALFGAAGAIAAAQEQAAEGLVSLRRCAEIAGLYVTQSRGVAYVSAHEAELSYDLCYLIRATLGVERRLTPKDCCDIEEEQLLKHGQETLW